VKLFQAGKHVQEHLLKRVKNMFYVYNSKITIYGSFLRIW